MVVKKMKDQITKHESPILSESIEDRILRIRGINVMIELVTNCDHLSRLKVEKHDKTIHFLVVTLGHLMQPTEIKDKRKIGFKLDKT